LSKSLKIFCLLLTIYIGAKDVCAQENEFGFWAGTSVFLGDLNPTVSFKNARWATGAFYRYNFNNRMAVRAQMNYGFLDAADSRIKRFPYLQARNLNFKSQLVELAATFEINFFKYSLIKSRDTKRWTPYIFMGGSLFYYNPYTQLEGVKYKLESVGTEGQKTANRPTKNRGYDQYAFAIPYGIGVKVALNNNWAINVEASSRITFTDYIDDVSGVYAEPEDINYFVNGVNVGPALADRSTANIGIPGKQRGTSKDKDRFMFVGIGLTYTIQTTKCPKVL
jgi:hypothetical protein